MQPVARSAGRQSRFFPPDLVERLRENVERDGWVRSAAESARRAAEPWLRMSYDELWSLMFGPTLPRSWMVWSDGHCPSCGGPVRMYDWRVDAVARPWKLECPRCSMLFPTNDFGAFHRSGLDGRGVFDPALADRSLLFNVDHPDPADPLRGFGVDDGTGYRDADGRRWRFIPAYLIYGQWKQLVLGGILRLAEAHLFTGSVDCARRAAILLDRVADLYPGFDFGAQGEVYEVPGRSGYVSTWHDACEETRRLALACDAVMPALADDAELVAFLSSRARAHGLANPKATVADIRRNLEAGILRHALDNRERIHSNYPRPDITVAEIMAIIDDPERRDELSAHVDAMIERATAVDGVTGEKGLSGYSSFVLQGLAEFLALCDQADPGFLERCLERHPRLRSTFQFHVDTWCFGRYYPLVGDTGQAGAVADRYVGVIFRKDAEPLAPSMYTFLWRLYGLTGDRAYVQALVGANDGQVAGLPWDLYAPDAEGLRAESARSVAEHGLVPEVPSINRQEWGIAILRSGSPDRGRAAWLAYGIGGGHHHRDGLNLGLYAFGTDLMPDLGYPPVQYGGWSSPRADWYRMSASHNTVVVDRTDHAEGLGRTTLWADGPILRAIRVSAPGMALSSAAGGVASGATADTGSGRFERTVVLVDLPDPGRFYLVDIFRVKGGREHIRFMHSLPSSLRTHGLALAPGGDYGHGAVMRDFRWDRSPTPGWQAEWRIGDDGAPPHLAASPYGRTAPSGRSALGGAAPGADREPGARSVTLRYTDFTTGAEAGTAEGWLSRTSPDDATGSEEWMPRILVRRAAESGDDALHDLESTFAGVIDAWEAEPGIASVRRCALRFDDGRPCPDSSVALEVTAIDGTQDLLVAADPDLQVNGASGTVAEQEWGVRLTGELCLLRRTAGGAPAHVYGMRG